MTETDITLAIAAILKHKTSEYVNTTVEIMNILKHQDLFIYQGEFMDIEEIDYNGSTGDSAGYTVWVNDED